MYTTSSDNITGPDYPALLIDIGNTSTVVGYAESGSIRFTFRIPTHASDTYKNDGVSLISRRKSSVYSSLIRQQLARHRIDPETIRAAALASVVPAVTERITEALQDLTGITPLIVSCHTGTGLVLDVDQPETVGTDLIVGAYAAARLYGTPVIIVDMGTATTFAAVDDNRHYLGHCILPGIGISLQAMLNKTAQLPDIALTEPHHVLGKNTSDAMNNGILHSSAAMIDGMIGRISRECGFDTPVTVTATGGLSCMVVPLCSHTIIHDDCLILKGLFSLLENT